MSAQDSETGGTTGASEIVLAPGSWVVVTGANGNIGSHIADQLLHYGYRVRAAVRNAERSQWLQDLLDARYGPGRVELVEVPDMAPRGAYDGAAAGASAFIHTATPIFASADPDAVIPAVVDGTVHALESAAREPGLTRFVLTSSSGACPTPAPNAALAVTADTWNEASVRAAYQPPPPPPPHDDDDDGDDTWRRMHVYYASKTRGEQAAWAWVRAHAPRFAFNAVLPNTNFGPVLDARHQGHHGAHAWVRALYDSGARPLPPAVAAQPPQHFVHVRDDAALHVAALVYGDVRGERLFAFARPYNFDDILGVMRRIAPPGRRLAAGFPGQGRDLSTVPNARAEALLRRLTGHGWTGLEETVRQAMQGYT